ncbi:MAG: sigma-54-dependent Fis family transcriptional regulator [Deltaproteobacteria bacterium]|nr:sigma-54-dependent Fis family transcriptional regulator [Deltaproteobacteria bacterium]MBW1924857.1 sigma-54-dependent Fis family transcriptional regulator [Deltaproteobacteria bacterium]MBW1950836.1 sigma-54-dependent Fis family transcriptional regulator [Deltaproteobacteria bacterium]MBW2008808.1 sigma-54-dependent Fis family transcriptional regulator [Deltaproteobacteria bacterium]MBW2103280.1 sigma-54-dependent Fis family transcriptional regulator [Deltaproteobacteria bacterium]
MDTVLIVDDEKNYLVILEALLAPEGYEILTASDGREALRLIHQSDLDLVITDVKMPGMSGMELLEACKEAKPEVPVIVMTAYGSIEMAVEAMKKHAFDYITKPFQNEQLKLTVRKALENYRLIQENKRLSRALSERFTYGNIVGKSKAMREIFDLIDRVSPSKTSVLISGPSGTGKELIAKAIHFNSPRSDRPFISVNCGALAETLLESELFGHERGAFTGAVSMRKGRFEVADGGTLFLDEVGDMPASLQVKLLRVLQEMEFERVGGTRTIRVDVRILSASNRNLRDDVAAGTFREDLFYRLNVMEIRVPSLRERIEDIPLLSEHFLEKYKGSRNRKVRLAPEVHKILFSYDWPGNIRELENVIERALVLCPGDEITPEHLPPEILDRKETEIDLNKIVPLNMPLPEALEQVEEKLIQRALAYTNHVQSRAAEMLGISRHVMHYKMKKYGLLT